MKNIRNVLTLNTLPRHNAHTFIVTTILILLTGLITTNNPSSKKTAKQKTNNQKQISLGNNNLATSCDSTPYYFKKHIDIIEKQGDQQYPYDLARMPNGKYLMAGHIGQTNNDHEGYMFSFDTLGNINWAKIVGIDGSYYDSSPSFTNDVYEFIWNIDVLDDSTTLITGRRENWAYGLQTGFVAKVGVDGDILWAKQLRGLPNLSKTIISGLSKTSDGSIFITGSYRISSSPFDSFILQIDAEGNLLNSLVFETQGSSYPSQIAAQWSGGHYYFFGNRETAAPVYAQTSSLTIIKTDANLNILQTKNIFADDGDYIRLQTFIK